MTAPRSARTSLVFLSLYHNTRLSTSFLLFQPAAATPPQTSAAAAAAAAAAASSSTASAASSSTAAAASAAAAASVTATASCDGNEDKPEYPGRDCKVPQEGDDGAARAGASAVPGEEPRVRERRTPVDYRPTERTDIGEW